MGLTSLEMITKNDPFATMTSIIPDGFSPEELQKVKANIIKVGTMQLKFERIYKYIHDTIEQMTDKTSCTDLDLSQIEVRKGIMRNVANVDAFKT